MTNNTNLNRLEALESLIQQYTVGGSEFIFKYALIKESIRCHNSRVQVSTRKKVTERRINKTKVKGKMYALFNLKCSRKFVAFYSVSFPAGTSDEECFTCWNYFLTACRKRFNLENYVWVTERQKNETLHFHMLTNNYMPIYAVNKCMAIVIDNRVAVGAISWGNSSKEKYNGVDVDSVFNSKRHKKTGKNMNATELRNWLVKYVTKYVAKNSEKFTRLCWHCSRSVSELFTSTIELFESRFYFTRYLPTRPDMYIEYKSDFNRTFVYKFVPDNALFDKIRLYNDLLFGQYVPLPPSVKLCSHLNNQQY